MWRPVSLARLDALDPSSLAATDSETHQPHTVSQPQSSAAGKGSVGVSGRPRKASAVPKIEDYPVGWPDASLDPAPSHSAPLTRALARLSPIAGASGQGYVVLYRDVSSRTAAAKDMGAGSALSDGGSRVSVQTVGDTVLACYSMQQILLSLCPGIVSIMNEVDTSGEYDLRGKALSPVVLYNLLTGSQRLESSLKVAQVESLYSFLSLSRRCNSPMNRLRSSLKTMSSFVSEKSKVSTTSSTSGGAKARLTMKDVVNVASKANSRSSANPSTELTESKIRLLNSMSAKHNESTGRAVTVAPITNEQYLQIAHWDNVKTADAISKQARLKSAMEKTNRSSKLMNRLHELSNWFE